MIELVWDTATAATVSLGDDQTLQVGGSRGLDPADLAAAAAAADVMSAFMAAAEEAGAPILGYAATADVDTGPSGNPVLHLRSYVVAPAGMTDERFSAVAEAALRRSSVSRLVGGNIAAEWDLRVLRGATCAEV